MWFDADDAIESRLFWIDCRELCPLNNSAFSKVVQVQQNFPKGLPKVGRPLAEVFERHFELLHKDNKSRAEKLNNFFEIKLICRVINLEVKLKIVGIKTAEGEWRISRRFEMFEPIETMPF